MIYKRLKANQGITLIALIVTIIVLLILAGVSISTLTGENGILTQAKTSKEKTERASVIEQARTDVLAKQAENKSGTISKTDFKVILDKYFKEVPEDYTGDTVLTTQDKYGKHEIKVSEIYDGIFSGEGGGETPSKTIEDLKAGDRVYYDTGVKSVGNNGVIECRVLYDKAYNESKGTNYGVQIISSDVVGEEVTLGNGDFEKSKESYNNALKTLYDEAQKYLNPSLASIARCVGSDPADPDWDTSTNEAGYYTKEIATENDQYYSYMEKYYGAFKNGDRRDEIDYTQMGAIKVKSASTHYWCASRYVDSTPSTTGFTVGCMDSDGWSIIYHLCGVSTSDGAYGRSHTFSFRPVFSLKSGIKITNGDGVNTPYTLQP